MRSTSAYQQQIDDIDARLRKASKVEFGLNYAMDVQLLLTLIGQLEAENSKLRNSIFPNKEMERAVQAIGEIQQVLSKHDFCCLSMPIGGY